MKKQEFKVKNAHGIHLRVAGEIVKLAKSHECSLSLSCHGCPRADACSILQVLTLGASKGDTVDVVADGPDADIVVKKLGTLFADGAGI